MKVGKVPQRKCLGCGEMKEKKELIRVVRSPEGIVSVDKPGKNLDVELMFAKARPVLLKQYQLKLWKRL